jgi:hypothetical protein
MCNCTSKFDAESVIGPRFARTRWRRPGMTTIYFPPKCQSLISVTKSTKVRTLADNSREVG